MLILCVFIERKTYKIKTGLHNDGNCTQIIDIKMSNLRWFQDNLEKYDRNYPPIPLASLPLKSVGSWNGLLDGYAMSLRTLFDCSFKLFYFKMKLFVLRISFAKSYILSSKVSIKKN